LTAGGLEVKVINTTPLKILKALFCSRIGKKCTGISKKGGAVAERNAKEKEEEKKKKRKEKKTENDCLSKPGRNIWLIAGLSKC